MTKEIVDIIVYIDMKKLGKDKATATEVRERLVELPKYKNLLSSYHIDFFEIKEEKYEDDRGEFKVELTIERKGRQGRAR